MIHARPGIRSVGLVLLGAILGAVAYAALSKAEVVAEAQTQAVKQPVAKQPAPTLASLAADMEIVKAKAPDQSHVMEDVSYHFSNLWFAGQHGNWALADFYLSEAISHLHWAVRVIPIRKDAAGRDVILKDILQALENSPLKQLQQAVKAKDRQAFDNAYRFTLEGCYACHKAVNKPYLHPQIPTEPATPIINFEANPDWPR
jgi:hypothetical protein